MTGGYAFAFQVLGHVAWQSGIGTEETLDAYRAALDDSVYDKIWSELSGRDKDVLHAMALSESGTTAEIKRNLGSLAPLFNQYRKRLLKRGVAVSSGRGFLDFSLPLFRDYVEDNWVPSKVE